MRLPVFIIFGLAAVVAHSPAQSQGRACPPYAQPVKVNFATENAPTTYSNEYNVTGIQSVMRRRGHVIAGLHQRALGLTSSQIAFSIAGRTYATPVSGGYCMYLSSIDVRFGYQSMDVFIASEYRPQTCEYNTILDHENQHVAINRNTVREYAPRVRQALERHVATLQPRFTANAQVSTDRKIADVKSKIDPLLDQMERVLAERNAAIDTNVNYAALSDNCKNWDQGNVWPVVKPSERKR